MELNPTTKTSHNRYIFDILLLGSFCLVFSLLGSVGTYLLLNKNQPAIIIPDFQTEVLSDNLENSQYGFMPKEMSDYILSLCEELKVDPNLVLAILLNENPMLDTTAINRNTNASVDIGLFQLNSAYLWTSFKKNYWKFDKDVEYDPFNYKVNAYIAISHLKHLSDRLHVFDDVVMAYNCGESAVMKNRVPESTKEYLARAKKNYYLLVTRAQETAHQVTVPNMRQSNNAGKAMLTAAE